MGSKSRIAKYILPIILKNRTNQLYIEPFAGGMNTICQVSGSVIASDSNFYLIEMWKKVMSGWIPKLYSKDEYLDIRANAGKYDPAIVGWVGFNCSYSGKWFGGFAGETKTKDGIRNYQDEAIRNVIAQSKKMGNVKFIYSDYNKIHEVIDIPRNSIVYCDPPYADTTKYFSGFDSANFWQWAREMCYLGHEVYVSEYKAPDDFKCIWQTDVKSSLSANGKIGGSKNSTERLFIFNE